MSIIVYTALFADEGIELKDVGEFAPYAHNKGDVKYIAFTNRRDLTSDFWDVQYTDYNNMSPRMASRSVKWETDSFLGEHTYSIWLDSHCYLKHLPEFLFPGKMTNYHTRIHRHTDIPSVYLEGALVNYEFRSDLPGIVNRQLEKYFEEGLPFLYDHYETGVLIRRNCKESNDFNSSVFNEVYHNSIRDQIAVPYCVWKARSNGDAGIETIMESFLPHQGLMGFPKSNSFICGSKPREKLIEDLGTRRVLQSVRAQQLQNG